MPKKKINHDYTCDKCGKPATRNIQNIWKEYEINSNGNFIETDSWEGNGYEFYCDDCVEETDI